LNLKPEKSIICSKVFAILEEEKRLFDLAKLPASIAVHKR